VEDHRSLMLSLLLHISLSYRIPLHSFSSFFNILSIIISYFLFFFFFLSSIFYSSIRPKQSYYTSFYFLDKFIRSLNLILNNSLVFLYFVHGILSFIYIWICVSKFISIIFFRYIFSIINIFYALKNLL
jgi:hypothetical protein